MGPEAWTALGGLGAALLILAGVFRTNRSTDRSAELTAAAAIRAEGDRKLEQAWESRLAQKDELVEELRTDLEKATTQLGAALLEIKDLGEQVAELTEQLRTWRSGPDGA